MNQPSEREQRAAQRRAATMSTSSNPSTTSADPIAGALKEERQDKYAQAIRQGDKFEPGDNLETNSNDLRALLQSMADAAPQLLADADGNFIPLARIVGPHRANILKLMARMFRAGIGAEAKTITGSVKSAEDIYDRLMAQYCENDMSAAWDNFKDMTYNDFKNANDFVNTFNGRVEVLVAGASEYPKATSRRSCNEPEARRERPERLREFP